MNDHKCDYAKQKNKKQMDLFAIAIEKKKSLPDHYSNGHSPLKCPIAIIYQFQSNVYGNEAQLK